MRCDAILQKVYWQAFAKGEIMKKTRSPKLTLSRETLRQLDEALLEAPRGGASMQPQSCITCGQICQEYTVVSRSNC